MSPLLTGGEPHGSTAVVIHGVAGAPAKLAVGELLRRVFQHANLFHRD